jgi:hypothetical protein
MIKKYFLDATSNYCKMCMNQTKQVQVCVLHVKSTLDNRHKELYVTKTEISTAVTDDKKVDFLYRDKLKEFNDMAKKYFNNKD